MDEIQKNTVVLKSDGKYRDTVFRTLFHNEERAIELFNAIGGTDYPRGTPVKFLSKGDKSLSGRKSDLAVVIDNQLLAMQEHQSSINPNMPLRFLPYTADVLYTWLNNKADLHKNRLVTIPTPKFYVLYNGKDELKQDVLQLSDAFRTDSRVFSMELVVKVIDINHSKKNVALQKSPSLGGYAYLMEQIRERAASGVSRDIAIAEAVRHCIKSGIIEKFLKEHYEEVCGMLMYEISYEDEMAIKVEEAREDAWGEALKVGMQTGRQEGKHEGMIMAAMRFVESGMTLQDVANTLQLSDALIDELKKSIG